MTIAIHKIIAHQLTSSLRVRAFSRGKKDLPKPTAEAPPIQDLEKTLASAFCASRVDPIFKKTKDKAVLIEAAKAFYQANKITHLTIEAIETTITLMKVIRVAVEDLLPDPRIPESMKPYLNTDNIIYFISILYKRMPQGSFRESQTSIRRYTKLVNDIQAKLIDHNHPKALEFKPRKEFLINWCRILIETTSHPLLLNERENAAYMTANKDKLDQLFGAEAKLVLFICMVDDIADILQDEKLLSYFINIPDLISLPADQVSNEIKKIMVTMKKDGYGEYAEFFEFAGEMWSESIFEIHTIMDHELAEDIRSRETLEAAIITNIKKVMFSMSQSVSINVRPETFKGHYDDVERDLAPNMLMTFFKAIEKGLLKSEKREIDPKTEATLDRIFEMGEIIGHSGNNIATLMREIQNGDISNTLILIIDAKLRSDLSLWGMSFNRYLDSLFASQAHNISETIISFLELAVECSKSNKKLMALATEFCTAKKVELHEFADTLSDIKNDEEIHQFKTKYLQHDDDQRFQEIMKELQHKSIVLKAVQLILDDKKTTPLQTYYERINTYFDKIMREFDTISVPGSDQYVKGIYNLFVLYLLFKSDM